MNRMLCVVLVSLLAAAGCKQKQGERCQVESDCEDGLVCNKGKDPPVCDDAQGGTAIDAMLPIDAAPDAP